MIAVIFEVWPIEKYRQSYLDTAAYLRETVESIDGFISIERFESLSDPTKILSISFFRDEAAVTAWRNTEAHRDAQVSGRSKLFSDYRLRIASVIRDYGKKDRTEAPEDSITVNG